MRRCTVHTLEPLPTNTCLRNANRALPRREVPTLFGALLLAGAMPALAFGPGIDCADTAAGSLCTIAVSPGGAAAAVRFQTALENIAPTANGFHVVGDTALLTPMAALPLLGAELWFGYGEGPDAGLERMGGRSYLPFPADGLLGPVVLENLVLAELGLDLGSNLAHLGAHLNPARDCDGRAAGEPGFRECPYLFFHFRMGLAGSMGPISFEVPGGSSATFVLDPTDPYFYLAGSFLTGDDGDKPDTSAPGDAGPGGNGQTGGTSGSDNGSQTAGQPVAQPGKQTPNANPGDPASPSTAGEPHAAPVPPAPADDGGEATGFGFSLNGWIPFVPQTTYGFVGGLPGFNAHLVVDAEVPLTGVPLVLTGSVFYRFPVDERGNLAPGLTIGGNGNLAVGIPFLQIFSFGFDLGAATAYVDLDEWGADAVFSGILEPDTDFLPAIVPIAPRAALRVAGRLSDELLRSFVQADGEFDLGLGAIGPVDFSDLAVMGAALRISPNGLDLTGRSSSSFHPAVGSSGQLAVAFHLSPIDPQDSFARLTGALAIGGVALGSSAMLEVGGHGARVEGTFDTALSAVRLSGALSDRGAQLTGETQVRIPLTAMQAAFDAARADLAAAQAEVNRLDHEIAHQGGVVEAERRRDRERLKAAERDLQAARTKVDGLNASIASHQRSIDNAKRAIAAKRAWYNRQPWYNKTWAWAEYAAVASAEGAKISYHTAAIGTLTAARTVAQLALDVARETVRATATAIAEVHQVPVEADPRVAGVIAARVLAWGTLEVVRAAVPDLPAVPGDLGATIQLSLTERGMDGRVTGNLCVDAQCTPVAGGRVTFSPQPRVCVWMPKLPEACTLF